MTTPQTYGEKITGIWHCDSVLQYNAADSSFISKTTDPVVHKFIPNSEGVDYYDWVKSGGQRIVVKMEEADAYMYQVTLGESTWRWQIRQIDEQTCYLYRPPGTFFPYIEKIYLSR